MKVQITPIGHATVLIEVGELRILTDPVWSDRIGVSFGPLVLGSRRLQPPPIQVEELPPVDVVLLSHAHFDHCDIPTLRRLPRSAIAVVHRNNRGLVRRFAEKRELLWGESTWIHQEEEPFLQITATPSRHWGARMLVDQWRGWGGFLLEIPSIPSPFHPGTGLSILFAGDTALTSAFEKLREERQGAGVDLAIMPIGAYDPWIMNHCTPEQAWKMAMKDLGAHLFMPVHHSVFVLSREPVEEPIHRLRQVAAAHGQEDRVVGDFIGTPFSLSLAS